MISGVVTSVFPRLLGNAFFLSLVEVLTEGKEVGLTESSMYNYAQWFPA